LIPPTELASRNEIIPLLQDFDDDSDISTQNTQYSRCSIAAQELTLFSKVFLQRFVRFKQEIARS